MGVSRAVFRGMVYELVFPQKYWEQNLPGKEIMQYDMQMLMLSEA